MSGCHCWFEEESDDQSVLPTVGHQWTEKCLLFVGLSTLYTVVVCLPHLVYSVIPNFAIGKAELLYRLDRSLPYLTWCLVSGMSCAAEEMLDIWWSKSTVCATRAHCDVQSVFVEAYNGFCSSQIIAERERESHPLPSVYGLIRVTDG